MSLNFQVYTIKNIVEIFIENGIEKDFTLSNFIFLHLIIQVQVFLKFINLVLQARSARYKNSFSEPIMEKQ